MRTESQTLTKLIQRIHDSPTMAVLSVAGAGTAAISWLLGVAGASRSILEILVPYAPSALTEFVGHEPPQFVSEETAAAMAHSAYRRAVHLRQGNAPVVGVGCTATIATDRTKRGEHRCHVAAWSRNGVTNYTLTFVKELRHRRGEDEIASKLVLCALSESAGVEFNLDLHLDPSEQVLSNRISYADGIEALLAEHIDCVVIHTDGHICADERVNGGILSGSFNPLHEGHEAMANAAEQILGDNVAYELSVANVDKPPLQADEVRRRVAQLAGRRPLILTRVPVFYEKSLLLPECTFIIGADTAVRVVDPHYYGDSLPKMLTALEQMRLRGCRFLVAGRSDGRVFRTLSDVAVPDGFEAMFTAIPESAFRSDMSSTAIRQAGAGASA